MICLYLLAKEPSDSGESCRMARDKNALYLVGLRSLRDFVNTMFCGLGFLGRASAHKGIKHGSEFVVGVLV